MRNGAAKWAAWLLAALAAASTAAEASFKNLAPNPSFEVSDPQDPNRPADWRPVVRQESGKPKGQPIFTYERQGQDGKRSVSIACPTGDEWGEWQSAPFPATPGKDYTVIFYYYCAPEPNGHGVPEVGLAGNLERLDEWARVWTRHSFTAVAKSASMTIDLHLYYNKGQKVYFDNFLVVPTESLAVPASPAMGAILQDGAVMFNWKPAASVSSYRLMLSQDKTFPPEKTESILVMGAVNTFKPEKLLASGPWFWKVFPSGAAPFAASFITAQEFLVGPELEFRPADTTPPVVNGLRPVPDASSVAPDVAISAKISDAGSGIDPATLKVALDGKDAGKSVQFADGKLTLKPAALLAAGVHVVEISVKDKAGNSSNAARWRFSVGEPMKTSVRIRPDLRCEINGEPFFPLGLYSYAHNARLEEIADAGFNTILEEDGATISSLDFLAAAGLKATAGIPELPRTTAPTGDPVAMLEERFGAAVKAQHPAFLSYWADEPHEIHIPAMKAIYEAVKKTDPNHPALWCIDHRWSFPVYAGISDGLMIDPYPFYSKTAMTVVSDTVDAASKASADKKPVWVIPQAFDQDDAQKGREALPANHLFRPTPAEIRFMTYLAITRGVMGIEYWASDTKCDIAQWPKDWAGLLKTAGEIRHLIPVLLGKDDVKIELEPPEQGIFTLARKVGDSVYVIAVNTTSFSLAPQIKLPRNVSAKRALALFEDRAAEVKDNAVTDIFRPEDAHVYEFR